MRKFNENIPVGPNALDEFGISPVRDRGYPSPMGPNSGPIAPPQPEPPFTPWAGPLSLAPEMPEGFFSGSPQIRTGPSFAENLPFSLVDEPGLSIADQLDPNLVPLSAEGLGRGIQNGSFADQLGTPARGFDVPDPRAMPSRPRGVSGPFSAQLSDPRLPQGLQLIDDTPPRQPFFGPADEFPGPAAPDNTAAILQQLATQNPNMTISELLALLNQGP
jgi:hypothetical protein